MRTHVTVELVIEHEDNGEPRDVVDSLLDAGFFQDAINEHDHESGPLHVVSAVARDLNTPRVDHGLRPEHVALIQKLFENKEDFFIETLTLPMGLSSLECGARGQVVTWRDYFKIMAADFAARAANARASPFGSEREREEKAHAYSVCANELKYAASLRPHQVKEYFEMKSKKISRRLTVTDSKQYLAEIHTAIEASDGRGETPLFRFRAFRNGNLHLEFRRHDLLDRFNKIAGGRRLRPKKEDAT